MSEGGPVCVHYRTFILRGDANLQMSSFRQHSELLGSRVSTHFPPSSARLFDSSHALFLHGLRRNTSSTMNKLLHCFGPIHHAPMSENQNTMHPFTDRRRRSLMDCIISDSAAGDDPSFAMMHGPLFPTYRPTRTRKSWTTHCFSPVLKFIEGRAQWSLG